MTSSAPALHVDVRLALGGFDLDVRLEARDEVLVLFGPSGAGKTTILNTVAGLARPDHGVIRIDDTVVFSASNGRTLQDVPTRRRGVGYVMQHYALFPHMTALENVAFPMGRAPDRLSRARRLLDLLGMDGHEGHLPDQLSGGQKQRVAVARALAAERRVLLLDEPFAALDGAIRDRLQADLRRIRSELGITALLVTHRLDDAFAVGDRLAVMSAGRIEQVGAVDEVFQRPATPAVARVLGIRNIIEAVVVRADADAIQLDWDGLLLQLPPQPELSTGTRVSAYIRPDDVKFIYPDRALDESMAQNLAAGRVTAARESAGSRLLWVELSNGHELEVSFPRLSYSRLNLGPGSEVGLAMRRGALTILAGSARG
jgi:molybdate transport system ATP-binding protein